MIHTFTQGSRSIMSAQISNNLEEISISNLMHDVLADTVEDETNLPNSPTLSSHTFQGFSQHNFLQDHVQHETYQHTIGSCYKKAAPRIQPLEALINTVDTATPDVPTGDSSPLLPTLTSLPTIPCNWPSCNKKFARRCDYE